MHYLNNTVQGKNIVIVFWREKEREGERERKKILVGWVSQNNNDFLIRLDSPNGNISVSRHCNGLNKSFKNIQQFKTNKPPQVLGETHYNIIKNM